MVVGFALEAAIDNFLAKIFFSRSKDANPFFPK